MFEGWQTKTKANIAEKVKSGEYQPSSVWETRGWDKTLIETKCTDWIIHPELDIKMYKVVTLAEREVAQEIDEVGMRLSATGAPQVGKTGSKGGGGGGRSSKLPEKMEDWTPEQHKAWMGAQLKTLELVKERVDNLANEQCVTEGPRFLQEAVKELQDKFAIIDGLQEASTATPEIKAGVEALAAQAKEVEKKVKHYQASQARRCLAPPLEIKININSESEIAITTSGNGIQIAITCETETHLNKHYKRGQASTSTVSLETTHANIGI